MKQDLRQKVGFSCLLVKIPPPEQDNDSDVKYGGKSLSWSRLRLRSEGEAASQGWEAGGGKEGFLEGFDGFWRALTAFEGF